MYELPGNKPKTKHNTVETHQSQREQKRKKKKEQRELQKQPENYLKMAMSTYVSVIKCKWPKCSNQKT